MNIFQNCFERLVLRGSSLHPSLDILARKRSQGSVATRFRCDCIFNYCFTGDLLLILKLMEFSKSAGIWKR